MNTLVLTKKQVTEQKESQIPECGDGEIIVQVEYCGICRTDRKAYRMGQIDLHMPRVLGHEISGTVIKTGDKIDPSLVGTQVNVHPGIGCHECAECESGNDQCCTKMQILGFHLDGGFCRYLKIPEKGVKNGIIRRLPENVDLRTAALCEPLGCAVHMADFLPLETCQSVLISGGGVLGSLMAHVLRYKGIDKILITEPAEYKRNVLKELGFIVFSPDDLSSAMDEMAIGAFDAAIPCNPYSVSLIQSLKVLKPQGVLGFFSGLTDFEGIDRDTINLIHYKELYVKGTYGCGEKDTRKALEMLSGGLDISGIPIREVRLEQAENILKQTETDDSFITMISYREEIL